MESDLQIPFEKGKTVACVLTRASGKSGPVGIILAHGAGGDMHSGNLAHYAAAFAGAGFPCLRFTCKPTRLPYRVKACQAVMDGAAEVAGLDQVKAWIFAGHSMGARVASSMAAANPEATCGCIFFSYPLHTSDDQGNLRDQPLVDLTLPLLFVHGSKDSMCKAVPFAAVKARMSSIDLQVHEVEGGDHGLAVHAGKQSKPHTQHALKQVSAAICEFACMLEQNLVAELSLDGSQQQNTKSHHKQTHAVADSSSLGQEPPAKRNKLKM